MVDIERTKDTIGGHRNVYRGYCGFRRGISAMFISIGGTCGSCYQFAVVDDENWSLGDSYA